VEEWTRHGAQWVRIGSNPDASPAGWALRLAAEYGGSAEAVAELASRVDDVDALHDGRSALWCAVYGNHLDKARVLVAAGADPWLPMMSGWPPGRLALAGGHDLFGPGTLSDALSDGETAMVAEAVRLKVALGGPLGEEGLGFSCVADIDVAEVIRRLDATPVDDDPSLAEELGVFGATNVPGGCVLAQPWGFAPAATDVMRRLSAGTVCYAVYENPKSGTQGTLVRDGEFEHSPDPCGPPDENDPVLLSYLYQNDSVAYACAFTGLRPADGRAITGPPDVWLRLPAGHFR
jgi:hypothetical protein